MNFLGKKLDSQNGSARDLTDREKKLLAENQRLKKRNKRLSTAMVFLVDQIEVRLPAWTSKKAKPKPEPHKAKPTASASIMPLRKNPAKPKIIGTLWKPEKLDTDTSSVQARKKVQIRIEKDDTSFIKTEPAPAPIAEETPPLQPEVPVLAAEPIELATPVAPVSEYAPELAPEEVSLLAVPKTELTLEEESPRHKGSLLIEGEEKKTTAQEASNTYLAVSIAAAPMPDMSVPDDDDGLTIEGELSRQNEMMRAAMLRRVNRLRW